MTRRKREPVRLPPERVRNKQIKFWATQEEIDLIHQKMALYGTTNRARTCEKWPSMAIPSGWKSRN